MLLKDYLKLKTQTKKYEAKVATGNGNVAELHSVFVKDKFNKFYDT